MVAPLIPVAAAAAPAAARFAIPKILTNPWFLGMIGLGAAGTIGYGYVKGKVNDAGNNPTIQMILQSVTPSIPWLVGAGMIYMAGGFLPERFKSITNIAALGVGAVGAIEIAQNVMKFVNAEDSHSDDPNTNKWTVQIVSPVDSERWRVYSDHTAKVRIINNNEVSVRTFVGFSVWDAQGVLHDEPEQQVIVPAKSSYDLEFRIPAEHITTRHDVWCAAGNNTLKTAVWNRGEPTMAEDTVTIKGVCII